MTDQIDDYIATTVLHGDLGSRILAETFAPTLRGKRHVRAIVDGMNNIAVMDIPKDKECIVHSRGGKTDITDLFAYGESVVEVLVADAKRIGATPVGLADVIEVPSFNEAELRLVAQGIKSGADKYNLPVLNGEYAIHGYRIKAKANVSATLISTRDIASEKTQGRILDYHGKNRVVFGFFRTDGKPVFINSDGVGTKTELYELAHKYHLAVDDFMAMTMDDAAKIGAVVKIISGVLETKGKIPDESILRFAEERAKQIGIVQAIQREIVIGRLRGYTDDAVAYNLAGSVVSTIDEERLANLPRPSAADMIMAIVGVPNPRSNGITSRRADLKAAFGEDGYRREKGKELLDYLTTPSIVFYPFATEAINSGLATGFFHMSGGAYDGKFARPLAKHNLLGQITAQLFLRDEREKFFIDRAGSNPEVWYGKYPMNYDAFVTTSSPASIEALAKRYGLAAIPVGRVVNPQEGRKGLELVAWNGKHVYFSGNK